jgi:hypothetical protein
MKSKEELPSPRAAQAPTFRATIITADTSAVIMPYSMKVTPASQRMKVEASFRMTPAPLEVAFLPSF